MEMESCVPPGFRFHPTEEELVDYYLKRKINSLKIDLQVIADIDLYNMEPWDIQDRCKLGYDEQNEWYFFSHKDKKYPTGTRTNRATAAGFWKATGRDKAVLSKNRIIGMRKTLVFYRGRAPNGRKTDWIMHEYRIQTSENAPPQEEGWVVCRAFKKPIPNQKQGFEAWNHHACYVRDHKLVRPQSFPHSLSPTHVVHPYDQNVSSFQAQNGPDQFLESQIMEIPQLNSPTISPSLGTRESLGHYYGIFKEDYEDERISNQGGETIDWKNLDNFLASQVTDQTTSFSNSNMLDAQNHISHLFGCLPDL